MKAFIIASALTLVGSCATERYTDKQGSRKEETEWHNIVVWNKQGENCAQYLHKGSKVYVEGKLKTRKWGDAGNEKYTTEIIANQMLMLGSREFGDTNRSQGPPLPDFPGVPDQGPGDDDIPF